MARDPGPFTVTFNASRLETVVRVALWCLRPRWIPGVVRRLAVSILTSRRVVLGLVRVRLGS